MHWVNVAKSTKPSFFRGNSMSASDRRREAMESSSGARTIPGCLHTFSHAAVSDQSAPYLEGSAFSNSFRMDIWSGVQVGMNRLAFLCSLARGKNVVHIGCCDHAALIDQKIRSGEWLHERLTSAARRCIGIDINADAVNVVRQLGFDNIRCGDMTDAATLDSVIGNGPWDLAILGDVVEHLDNPVAFLAATANNLRGHVEEIVVSVPNAFCWENWWGLLRHEECVNSDHRYWFTPFTLAKVLTRAGYQPRGFLFVEAQGLQGRGLRHRLLRMTLRCFPSLSSTLVMTATIGPRARPHG
jgi:2-polyprenyl-3-methyl-5-hydroxy-6-metoxy-1,4-benzoquinol methylase